MHITINTSRINYLLDLYGLKVDEFLAYISRGRKNPITKDEVFSQNVKPSILKKVDNLFNRGFAYYIDESPVKSNKQDSIFFRKNTFNVELNLAAKKAVDTFERKKDEFFALSKLSNYNLERMLPKYTINDNPEQIAKAVRMLLDFRFDSDKRKYLANIINSLSSKNIIVFEFVEAHNLKEKANIDGLYITPNIIVLKRQQKAFRREIFTLAHELGHYLLDIEEVDKIHFSDSYNNLNKIEKWCNEFAFYFLSDFNSKYLESLDTASHVNDYHIDFVNEMSQRTHLSKLAIFTQLLSINKLSSVSYNKIRRDLKEQFEARERELNKKRELEKIDNIENKQTGAAPKAIISNIQKDIIRSAYHEGVINESQFCEYLKIKPESIENYLY